VSYDTVLLPEGLRLTDEQGPLRIVDAQEVPWVEFLPGGNGDPVAWRRTIIEICVAALAAEPDVEHPGFSTRTP
jgi:hypothetical protein